MPLPITALYLAVCCAFGSVLAFLPGKICGSSGISIGDGGRPVALPHALLADREARQRWRSMSS